MGRTEKVSVALDREDLAWARKHAKREGLSLSAVVSEAIRQIRQLEARKDVLAWLLEGQPPPTLEELATIDREIWGTEPGKGPKKRRRR